jgi:hypothetical protein
VTLLVAGVLVWLGYQLASERLRYDRRRLAAQQQAAAYERLLGLCQSLRRSHRCPGRCVLIGELRQSGMQAFWRSLDDGR